MARYSRRGYRKVAATSMRMGIRRFGSQRKVGQKYKGRTITTYRVSMNNKRIKRLEKMIETKEGGLTLQINKQLPHNNVYLVESTTQGGVYNPLATTYGTQDPMHGIPNRIGDRISVKGVMIKGFFENALSRPKVFYRVMLLKGAKGDTFDRSTIFKNDAGNKMIDQVNTERFSIVAQRTFTISASNTAASGVAVPSGAPTEDTNPPKGGVGSKIFKMWIPGRKFGYGGNVQYEQSSAQCKFYDYRLCILAYDWYGTPQDNNNVGVINEMYAKLYFKDA